MEFEGVYSALVAAVLISVGVGGDWARWTIVRSESESAQVASRVTNVTYRGSRRFHNYVGRSVSRSKTSGLIESESLSTGASGGGEVHSVRFCSDATLWMLDGAGKSSSSGVTIAGGFSIMAVPAENNRITLTWEPAE